MGGHMSHCQTAKAGSLGEEWRWEAGSEVCGSAAAVFHSLPFMFWRNPFIWPFFSYFIIFLIVVLSLEKLDKAADSPVIFAQLIWLA